MAHKLENNLSEISLSIFIVSKTKADAYLQVKARLLFSRGSALVGFHGYWACGSCFFKLLGLEGKTFYVN